MLASIRPLIAYVPRRPHPLALLGQFICPTGPICVSRGPIYLSHHNDEKRLALGVGDE